ncbi:Uu.00g125020.m01.CDS01 [Anthostomella pinea]|uniref:Uu.00g125020.m01.CDS01 n=1 Tax=Anthostomella pinea TaxID=933095 RepID=A0AAI8VHM0_9PEZI|nr:Uu.00g125020.m01.CDS01 [Anthostomella pinea]
MAPINMSIQALRDALILSWNLTNALPPAHLNQTIARLHHAQHLVTHGFQSIPASACDFLLHGLNWIWACVKAGGKTILDSLASAARSAWVASGLPTFLFKLAKLAIWLLKWTSIVCVAVLCLSLMLFYHPQAARSRNTTTYGTFARGRVETPRGAVLGVVLLKALWTTLTWPVSSYIELRRQEEEIRADVERQRQRNEERERERAAEAERQAQEETFRRRRQAQEAALRRREENMEKQREAAFAEEFLRWSQLSNDIKEDPSLRDSLKRVAHPPTTPGSPTNACVEPLCQTSMQELGIRFCKHSFGELVKVYARIKEDSGEGDVTKILRKQRTLWHPDKFGGCKELVLRQTGELAKIIGDLLSQTVTQQT